MLKIADNVRRIKVEVCCEVAGDNADIRHVLCCHKT